MTPEEQYQADQSRIRPYESYQAILRYFAMNASCRPLDVCKGKVTEIAAYHPETKQFAIFQRLEFETAKLLGWKALKHGLNFGVRNLDEQYLYSLKNEDVPTYPYVKQPGASPY
ncbi:hypothetical protein [Chroococcidiopsis thermalis]|uniref:Uncharacterized protein n=1 Tax=Chroococcidiopsis thermalis (strain PCC 7203) TaxID=251229 RepID=K9TWC0_CHRTP|nr:hypothetical protein [Chroococcidiopsis thermalis]AFY86698.1 hypothetical protein Chro_1171 [Chroococcidiopsis thermalis PCC 7203]